MTPTQQPRKVRFRGRQDRAYRFVYCVLSCYPAHTEEVVLHQCNNRRCIRPEHLAIGDKWDNLQDHYGFIDNGVDFGLL